MAEGVTWIRSSWATSPSPASRSTTAPCKWGPPTSSRTAPITIGKQTNTGWPLISGIPAPISAFRRSRPGVLRSEGRTILVDTGVGNHKERPYVPVWNHLDTAFLDNLAAAGVSPDDVDLVINTHLHIDHVGWNTRLDGSTWVPTFPNATYLMPQRDFDFWNPANGHKPAASRGSLNVFEDSVAPVHQAGLTHLWDETYQIDKNLRLDLAPGHTPARRS